VPFDCRHRQKYGPDICLTDCRSTAEHGGCEYARVERAGDLPPEDPDVIDVALLDMHHGWPNLGHDALVHGVQNAVCDLQADLAAAGLRFRVLSYEQVGAAAMLSRAQMGIHARRIVVSLPGSPNACRLALDKLLLPELGHLVREVGR